MPSSPIATIPEQPWAGATVVVAGSGPSLDADELALARGRARVLVVNATYQAAPWADAMYASDYRFWRVYRKSVARTFTGERWTASLAAAEAFGLRYQPMGPSCRYDPRNRVVGGANSGHQAIHLAALWGARRILLVGFDMQQTGGQAHWHGLHLGRLPNADKFYHWIEQMQELARGLARARVEVINCTTVSALQCFQRAKLDEIIGGE